MRLDRVTRERSNEVAGDRSFENVAARKLLPILDRSSFNPNYFASVIARAPVGVQNTFMDIIEVFAEHLSNRLKNNECQDNADLDLCSRAARIHDVTRHFRR